MLTMIVLCESGILLRRANNMGRMQAEEMYESAKDNVLGIVNNFVRRNK